MTKFIAVPVIGIKKWSINKMSLNVDKNFVSLQLFHSCYSNQDKFDESDGTVEGGNTVTWNLKDAEFRSTFLDWFSVPLNSFNLIILLQRWFLKLNPSW